MLGDVWMLRFSVRLLILHVGFRFFILYFICDVCWFLQMLDRFCFCTFVSVDVVFVNCDVVSPTPGP